MVQSKQGNDSFRVNWFCAVFSARVRNHHNDQDITCYIVFLRTPHQLNSCTVTLNEYQHIYMYSIWNYIKHSNLLPSENLIESFSAHKFIHRGKYMYMYVDGLIEYNIGLINLTDDSGSPCPLCNLCLYI